MLYKSTQGSLGIVKRSSKLGRFFDFFTTPSGRRVSLWLTGAGAFGLGAINFFPNTFFLKQYSYYLQLQSFDVPSEISSQVKKRIDAAGEKLNLDEIKRKQIKSFVWRGYDIKEIGTTMLIYGGRLGLPTNYFCKTIQDVDTQDIVIDDKPINWNSVHGKQLLESLILTEDEQIFAFCRSIFVLQSAKVLVNSIIPPATMMTIYKVGQILNEKQTLYVKPIYIRYIMYTLLGLFGYGIYALLTDFLQYQREEEIDQKLADLGPDMIKAGISFYDKVLKRNIAIYELSDHKLYAQSGDEQIFGRMKSIPLTQRKQFFEDKLEEYERSQKDMAKETSETKNPSEKTT